MNNFISPERAEYLCGKKRRSRAVHLCQIGVLVAFFGMWELFARMGIIDSFILSQPSRILKTLANMSQNHLLMHLGVTVYETVVGFVLGAVFGTAIAIVLWWSSF
ncbi:MAG: ABC transporter permease, partial [Oscillospiraceae bacterium]